MRSLVPSCALPFSYRSLPLTPTAALLHRCPLPASRFIAIISNAYNDSFQLFKDAPETHLLRETALYVRDVLAQLPLCGPLFKGVRKVVDGSSRALQRTHVPSPKTPTLRVLTKQRSSGGACEGGGGKCSARVAPMPSAAAAAPAAQSGSFAELSAQLAEIKRLLEHTAAAVERARASEESALELSSNAGANVTL